MDADEARAANQIPQLLTCRALKHALMRALNTRVAEQYDRRHPLALHMHRLTQEDLLIDRVAPEDQFIYDFVKDEFMGVPVVVDSRVPHGEVQVLWPDGVIKTEAFHA